MQNLIQHTAGYTVLILKEKNKQSIKPPQNKQDI